MRSTWDTAFDLSWTDSSGDGGRASTRWGGETESLGLVGQIVDVGLDLGWDMVTRKTTKAGG